MSATPEPLTPRPPALSQTHQTIGEHLEELRHRLIWCVAAWFVATAVGFTVAQPLIGWLKQPAGAALPRLAFLAPTEAVAAHMKVAMTVGLVCALPVILYHAWMFIIPGLHPSERRLGLGLIAAGAVLFAMGGAAGYALVLPAVLRFLLTFGGPEMVPMITVGRYVGFALGVIVACGLVCEMPLVIVGLVRIGLVTAQSLRRHRGIALIGLAAGAAILSPTTDAVSLLLCVGPLWLLYEVSVAVASLVQRWR
jgi:sec-independent protein translocase protein TatC